ncbi:hypothetical protein BKA70DRAFT_292864 [Coprinopsis sp. MPI-PUGE-AT-0042]|nr:hypothetical protein BKA70DRAFT_292864 [Coprinopsis sp. MPI-PUGE-AT-0042]
MAGFQGTLRLDSSLTLPTTSYCYPASPSTTSSFESFVRPTGVVPLNDTTTTNNVNADGSPRSSSGSNKKLVIPLAVIGALLGLLVIGIFLLWIFKFPHYCCGPARKVIYKHVHGPKPQRDEKGMIDLTGDDPYKRASSTTEEGGYHGAGKTLPPTPFDKPAVPIPAARQPPQPKMRRLKVPEIPGLAAFSTKVKSVRLSNPLAALRGGGQQQQKRRRGSKENSQEDEGDPIDRHFELMTTGSPLVPHAFGGGKGKGTGTAPYPTANNVSGGSFDPRTLVAGHTAAAPATNSNSDLSYVTAPNPHQMSTYPPQQQQSSPLSPLRHHHQGGGAGAAGSSGGAGKQSYGGNPYLLNSNPKASTSTAHARQPSSSAAAGMRTDGRATSNAGSTSPTVTVRQLALDLPYLQYLDALTVPASRISQLLSKSPSTSGGSQRGHQRNAGGSSRLAPVLDEESGVLRNVAPLSNKHLAALNVEVQKEEEKERRKRVLGNEVLKSLQRRVRRGRRRSRGEERKWCWCRPRSLR